MGMKVKIVANTFVKGVPLMVGQIAEVTPQVAQDLFNCRKAVPTDQRELVKVTEVATVDNRDPKPSRKSK